MAAPPATGGIRRILPRPHPNRLAKVAMLAGSGSQSIALVIAVLAVLDLRRRQPELMSGAILVAAVVLYLVSAFLTSYGYTHFDTPRAILLLPGAALLGIIIVALLVVTGGFASPMVVSTRTEGEPAEKPLDNFATGLLTATDAGTILGGPVGPPRLTGFGSTVSGCEFSTVEGYRHLHLTVVQGPRVPVAFDRQNKRGTAVLGIGDRAVISKHGLSVLVGDTELRLLVTGVKLDGPRQAALMDAARGLLARLQGQ